MIEVMRSKNIISEEDADNLHYTQEDENRLKKVLEDSWDSLNEYEKAICHHLNGTLLKWGKPRPPTEECMKRIKEIINRNPRTFNTNMLTD